MATNRPAPERARAGCGAPHRAVAPLPAAVNPATTGSRSARHRAWPHGERRGRPRAVPGGARSGSCPGGSSATGRRRDHPTRYHRGLQGALVAGRFVGDDHEGGRPCIRGRGASLQFAAARHHGGQGCRRPDALRLGRGQPAKPKTQGQEHQDAGDGRLAVEHRRDVVRAIGVMAATGTLSVLLPDDGPGRDGCPSPQRRTPPGAGRLLFRSFGLLRSPLIHSSSS